VEERRKEKEESLALMQVTTGHGSHEVGFFFNFNTFWKLILNLTRPGFFKTNIFGRAYCPGAAK